MTKKKLVYHFLKEMCIYLSKNKLFLKKGEIIMKCDLCGVDVSDENIKHVHIKGQVKNICEGCVTSVKGLIASVTGLIASTKGFKNSPYKL